MVFKHFFSLKISDLIWSQDHPICAMFAWLSQFYKKMSIAFLPYPSVTLLVIRLYYILIPSWPPICFSWWARWAANAADTGAIRASSFSASVYLAFGGCIRVRESAVKKYRNNSFVLWIFFLLSSKPDVEILVKHNVK